MFEVRKVRLARAQTRYAWFEQKLIEAFSLNDPSAKDLKSIKIPEIPVHTFNLIDTRDFNLAFRAIFQENESKSFLYQILERELL